MVDGADCSSIEKAARKRGLVYRPKLTSTFDLDETWLRRVRTMELESELCGEEKW